MTTDMGRRNAVDKDGPKVSSSGLREERNRSGVCPCETARSPSGEEDREEGAVVTGDTPDGPEEAGDPAVAGPLPRRCLDSWNGVRMVCRGCAAKGRDSVVAAADAAAVAIPDPASPP